MILMDGFTEQSSYFNVNLLTEAERLEAAALCFNGDALAWYQCEAYRRPMRRWAEMKTALLERLSSLAIRILNVYEEMLEENFVNGLKLEIRAEIKLMRHLGMDQIMDVAQRVEDRNVMLNQAQGALGLTRNNIHSFGPKLFYSPTHGKYTQAFHNSSNAFTEPRTIKLMGHIGQRE
ncbi:Uncharacterized protein Adt_21937 [Abeliophyllum distichum]|uniref:Retrotransposon gag domain-containing protein n=1 Tax=Abeliophyllum distichum TaxID=126358 RepID=A0ABD1T0T3_9LAMI